MRKLFLAIFVFAVMWGCVRDNLQTSETIANPDFTVQEARTFFENHMASTLATRSTSGKNGLIPGDFTIEWNNAKQSTRQTHSNLEFAIKGSYVFRVLRSEFVNGRAEAYIVPAYQKLLVVKNTERNRLSNYIMTIIPDRGYAEKHKNFNPQQFAIYGDHADFSGLVIYTTLENKSWPIQVTVFRSGRKVEDYSFFKFGADRAEKLKAMIETLKGLKICRKSQSAATRSFGEDSWDDLLDDLEQDMEDTYNDDPPPFFVDEVVVTPPWSWDEEPDVTDSSCPFCGGDPCACSDEPYIPDDDWDYPSIGDDDDPIKGDDKPLGKKHVASPNDKFAKPNIPTKMGNNQSQIASTCVFSSMSYIASIFGADTNQGTYMLGYWQNFQDPNTMVDGVSSKNLEAFLEMYFDVNPCKDIIDALNNGDIIIGNAAVENGGHAIVIVGYDADDNSAIFMDPISGDLRDTDPNNNITLSDIYTVTGIK